MSSTRKGWRFTQIPISAVYDPHLAPGALRLLCYLAWRQGSDDCCWPSISRMVDDLGRSARTIQRHLRELEEKGYLVITRRCGRSSRYVVVADPEPAPEEDTGTPDSGGRGPRSDLSPRLDLSPPSNGRGGGPAPAKRIAPDSRDGGPRSDLSPPPVNSDRGPRTGLSPPPASFDRGPPSRLSPTPVNSVPHDDKQGRNTRDRQRRDEKQRDDARLPSWSAVLENLRLQMTRASYERWLAGATARFEADTLVVGLADERAVEWVAHRFRRRMLATVRRVCDNAELEVAYEVRQDPSPRGGRGPP